MRPTPKIHEIYQHFKGQYYEIEGIAMDALTDKYTVVYRATYGDHALYVRDLENFLSEVDKEKYPDCDVTYRFTLVEDEHVLNSLNPELNAFIDAKGAEERLRILEDMHANITDSMISTMAIVLDTEIKEGPVEARYQALRELLQFRIRYEGSSRFR